MIAATENCENVWISSYGQGGTQRAKHAASRAADAACLLENGNLNSW
jgi:hypothetical protein